MDSIIPSPVSETSSCEPQKHKIMRVPASELISDILLNIFFTLRDLDSGNNRNAWDWTTVTKICGHWRRVALECPTLWTDIHSYRHLEEMQALCARSQQVDIKINLNIRDLDGDEVVDLFKQHVWRARELKINFSNKGYLRMDELLPGMTQHTKSLALCYHRKRSPYGMPVYGMVGSLPDVVNTTQLESLSLDSVFFPWSSSIYHGLVELSICDTERAMGEPTTRQLFDILDHCPKLEYLKLDIRWVHKGSEVSDTKEHTLNLPHLKTVILSGMSLPVCSTLLTIISIKEDASLDLSFSHVHYTATHPAFLERLSEILKTRRKGESLYIGVDGERATIRSNPILSGKALSSYTNICMKLEGRYSPQRILDATGAALGAPFWRSAEMVEISFEFPASFHKCMNADLWKSFLLEIPYHTRKLTVKLSPVCLNVFESFTGMSEALSMMDVQYRDRGEETGVLLPGLEELVVYYAKFSTRNARKRCRTFLQGIETRNRFANVPSKVRFLEYDETEIVFSIVEPRLEARLEGK